MKKIIFISMLSFILGIKTYAQKIIGNYGSIHPRMCEPFSVVEFIFYENGTFKRKRYNKYVTKGEFIKTGDTIFITKGQNPGNDHQSINSTYLIVGDTSIVDLDYYYDYFVVDKNNSAAFKKGKTKNCNPYRVYTKQRKISFPQKKITSQKEIDDVEEILSIIIKSDIFCEALDSSTIPFESYFGLNKENININLPNKKIKFLTSKEINLFRDTYFSFYHFNRLANGDYSILIRFNKGFSNLNPFLSFTFSKVDKKWSMVYNSKS